LDVGELQIALLECGMEYELKVNSALLCFLFLEGLLKHLSSLELSKSFMQWKHIATLTIIGLKKSPNNMYAFDMLYDIVEDN
jgi:hypothetical protein